VFDGSPNQRGDLGFVGHVGLHEDSLSARLLQQRNGFAAFLFAAAGHDDPGALAGESDGRGASDAAGSARHEGDLVFNILHINVQLVG
jgi:hypothetical protein